jgi:hypothetical protein
MGSEYWETHSRPVSTHRSLLTRPGREAAGACYGGAYQGRVPRSCGKRTHARGKFLLVIVLSLFCANERQKTIQRRKVEFPDRPLIRISSTFFWHLSSDYDLAPISSLAKRASDAKIRSNDQGPSIEDSEDTIYEPMKVGQQVQK